MSDDAEESEITNLAKDLNIKAVVPEVYKDIISPAAKEIGKGLTTVAKVINIALVPVSGLVWGFEQIESYVKSAVEKRLENKNPKDIQSPPLNIAGPLFESLRFAGCQVELSELYANLLASSMDKETASNAHPSFVEIIKQISPDEAKILLHLPDVDHYPDICQSMERSGQLCYSRQLYKGVANQFVRVCKSSGVEHKELSNSYLDNLRRLLLLEFRQEYGESIIEENSRKELILENESTEYITVTNLGQQFINSCVKPSY